MEPPYSSWAYEYCTQLRSNAVPRLRLPTQVVIACWSRRCSQIRTQTKVLISGQPLNWNFRITFHRSLPMCRSYLFWTRSNGAGSSKDGKQSTPDAVTQDTGIPDSNSGATATDDPVPEAPLDLTVEKGPIELVAYEVHADQLLASALLPEQLQQGWVRLFDGHTLAGWSIVGQADWQCRDGVLRVSRGQRSYLVTCFEIADCELSIDFRASPTTNSGIFLRTTPEPNDAGFDCLELNIAPPDNPYPTASMVLRQRVEPEELGDFDPTQWHTYHIRMDGEKVTVTLDGRQVLDLVDDTSSYRGHISLQHNEGVVEFRNILMRPLSARSLKLGSDWQDDWITEEREAGKLTVQSVPDGLKFVVGWEVGPKQFRRFLLQAQYIQPTAEFSSSSVSVMPEAMSARSMRY